MLSRRPPFKAMPSERFPCQIFTKKSCFLYRNIFGEGELTKKASLVKKKSKYLLYIQIYYRQFYDILSNAMLLSLYLILDYKFLENIDIFFIYIFLFLVSPNYLYMLNYG